MSGEGTPVTTWKPSRKWGVSVLTGAGALATMFLTSGSWDVEESIGLVGLIVTAGSTYLIPNAADA